MATVIQTAIDAISLGSLYMLLALGIALIFGIMQLVNFAHGELIMITGYALFLLVSVPILLALLGAVVVTVVAALIMERVAFRPVRGANPATLLVTSFAVSFLLQNVAILLTADLPRGIDLFPQLEVAYHLGQIRLRLLDLVTITTVVVLVVGLTIFLNRTAIGIEMRAAAEDFRMARLLGVNANRVIATAFAISGILAAAAGILLVSQIGTVSPLIGLQPVLVAFIATIVGGMGSLRGAILGGFVLGCITVVLQSVLPSQLEAFSQAFVFAVVIALLLLRPQGLLPATGHVQRV